MSSYYNINKKHPSFVVGNDKSSYKAGNSIHPFFYIVYGLCMEYGRCCRNTRCPNALISLTKKETKSTTCLERVCASEKLKLSSFNIQIYRPTYVVVLGIDFRHGHSVIHNMLLLIDLAKVHSY